MAFKHQRRLGNGVVYEICYIGSPCSPGVHACVTSSINTVISDRAVIGLSSSTSGDFASIPSSLVPVGCRIRSRGALIECS